MTDSNEVKEAKQIAAIQKEKELRIKAEIATMKAKHPDCKPATRGFVKRITQDAYRHTHEVNGIRGVLTAGTGIAGLAILFAEFVSKPIAVHHMPEMAWWSIGTFTTIMLILAVEFLCVDTSIMYPDPDDMPTSMELTDRDEYTDEECNLPCAHCKVCHTE